MNLKQLDVKISYTLHIDGWIEASQTVISHQSCSAQLQRAI